MNKAFRDVKKGNVFRPVGSPHWQTASSNATADKKFDQRGVYQVTVRGVPGEVTTTYALGHLVCECKS